MTKKARFQAEIGGTKLISTSEKKVLRKISQQIERKGKTFIVTLNPEFIVYAQKHPWFAKVLNQADFALPDGIGLVWASRFLAFRPLGTLFSLMKVARDTFFAHECKKNKISPAEGGGLRHKFAQKGHFAPGQNVIQERISGTDLMEKLCQQAAKKDWSIYLLGGKPRVAKKTLAVLKKRYPGLKGWAEQGPKLDLQPNTSYLSPKKEITKAIKRTNSKHPDLLLVALGMGKQEKFIWDNWKKLDVKLAMGVGGAFDYLSGQVPRAPKWVRKIGLEWLFRLIREPWRWRRQLALLEFTWLVIKEKFSS